MRSKYQYHLLANATRALAAALLLTSAVHAQVVLPSGVDSRFTPTGTQTTLAVGQASSNVVLPTVPGSVLVVNTGSEDAQIAFGNAAVIAPSSALKLTVKAGCYQAFATGDATYLAAITKQGTTTLSLFGGHGLPAHGCAAQ